MRSKFMLAALLACAIANQASAQSADDPHLAKNMLYKELLEKGIAISAERTLKFPTPTLADGLDKQAQLKVLQKLAGDDYPLEELTRNSVVAPHILKIHDLDTTDPARTGRGVDLWFIAHGNLDALSNKDLQTQFLANRKSNQITQLKEADLKERSLKAKSEKDLEETFVHAVGVILDRVQVRSTNHCLISRSKDSIALAARLDPRFNKDAAFPNQWRPIKLLDDGKEELGVVNAYEGAGMYLRLTRLHEPAGAVFVEFHQVFAEPKGWFSAPNMLRAKLPIAIQTEVRAIRREIQKAK